MPVVAVVRKLLAEAGTTLQQGAAAVVPAAADPRPVPPAVPQTTAAIQEAAQTVPVPVIQVQALLVLQVATQALEPEAVRGKTKNEHI